MIIDNIITARDEAKRFVRLISALEADIKRGEYGEPKRWNLVGGTKQTAAIRRASMDLTRALSELRRPT
jgi:hypothetical protein